MKNNLLTLVINLVVELVTTAADVVANHFGLAGKDHPHGRPD